MAKRLPFSDTKSVVIEDVIIRFDKPNKNRHHSSFIVIGELKTGGLDGNELQHNLWGLAKTNTRVDITIVARHKPPA